MKKATVTVAARGRKNKLVLQKMPYNAKFADQSFRVFTAKGEPVGEIIQDDNGEVFAHRASKRTDADDFQVTERVFPRKSLDSALVLAARWASYKH